MKIRVLGCHGGQLPHFSPVSFLINGHLILDGGAITSTLSIREQQRIREILITHSHMDHIKDLCFLAENLYLSGSYTTLPVYSAEAILTDLKRHVFNGIIWPQFHQTPKSKPIYAFRSIKKTVKLQELVIQSIPMNHSHTAVGFLISDKKGAVLFSGDTGPTQELWHTANRVKKLKAIFLELSFPAALTDLAYQTRHLSVPDLTRELSKMKHTNIPVYLYHFKPLYHDKIVAEVKQLGMKQLRVLKPKTTLTM